MVIGLDNALFKTDLWRENIIDLLRTALATIGQNIAIRKVGRKQPLPGRIILRAGIEKAIG